MRRLDKAIEDEKVSAQIVHLEDVTTKIVNFIVENPQKKSQVRKFFNYYLPTTLKLLNAYDRMDETGISGILFCSEASSRELLTSSGRSSGVIICPGAITVSQRQTF